MYKTLFLQQALSLLTLPESASNVALGLDDSEALTSLTIVQYDNTAQSNGFSCPVKHPVRRIVKNRATELRNPLRKRQCPSLNSEKLPISN